MLKGTITRFKESFIVATTTHNKVALHQPSADEQEVVKGLEWFSLEQIEACTDVIFPRELGRYLPAILEGHYPQNVVHLKD